MSWRVCTVKAAIVWIVLCRALDPVIAQTEPEWPPAQALRLSMLELMVGSDRHHTAHPFFWAPFVVLGEGAAVSCTRNGRSR